MVSDLHLTPIVPCLRAQGHFSVSTGGGERGVWTGVHL